MAMVPAPGLQIDIFVTNFKPLPPVRYNVGNTFSPTPPSILPYTERQKDFVPPTAHFARQGDRSFNDSLDSLDTLNDPIESYVDLGYYAGEHDDDWDHMQADFHTDHILDLTNFDGDIDAVLPGEEVLSHTLKKQGTLRRAKTRRATKATLGAKDRLHERLANAGRRRNYAQDQQTDPDGRSRSHAKTFSLESTHSTDRLLAHMYLPPAGIEHYFPAKKDVDHGEPHLRASGTQSPPVLSSNWDSRSNTATRDITPRLLTGATVDDAKVEIEAQEMNDVEVISEHARPGKPKLNRIVTDEVESSKGSTVVACKCFLLSLIIKFSYPTYRLWTYLAKCDGEENHCRENRSCSYTTR
jgi:hypothetical protein